MTKHHKLTLLAAALCTSFHAFAFDTFKVKDIRIEGIQRTEAGTVFSYLPVKVGDTLTEDKASAAISALYATGFFKDVRLENQDGVLIVSVEERPAIADISFNGMKEFNKDDIKSAFKQLGLSEGRILDRSLLDKAEQELKRQYYNRGYYGVQVKSELSPLERNRMSITFDVTEGQVAKIRSINIVGNHVFSEKKLLGLINLRTPGWLTWFTKDDQYSKQKLAGDLETLRSYYLNRGYIDARIDSTQVSISPDKNDIYITINLNEGNKYTVSGYKIAGELPVPEAELQKLVTLKTGDDFSREKLDASIKAMGDRLGNDGYAFANINASPEIDKEKKQVAFTFIVDPGRKVYVHRINIVGNTHTDDEVARREMRQMEGAWYDAEKINRSRERIQKLGFFKDVSVETPAVPDANDQVDLNVSLTEQSTNSFMLGAGLSSSEGLVLSGSVTLNNMFGTGKNATVQVNSGKTNKVYSLSFTDPYFTDDGVSLGYDIYRRDFDSSSLTAIAPYSTSTIGAGIRLGVPINEYDSINLGASMERYRLTLNTGAPNYMATFVKEYGGTAVYDMTTQPVTVTSGSVTTKSLVLSAGWSRDSRDSFFYPTKGIFQQFGATVGTPIGDLQYYKLSYQHQWLHPLTTNVTLMLNGQIGYGNGLSGHSLPFFQNFYAGGIGTVRGFDSGTLGPKALVNGNLAAIGGNKQLVGNAELLFPFPGAENDHSLRLSVFTDTGAVWGPNGENSSGYVTGEFSKVSLSDLRYSAGVAVTWISPMGPIKLSLAKPLKTMPGDKRQMFQFQLGQVF
jgi:outer membrane protein insertion porin family